tara:strand:- start:1430 stop:1909 length:480 start_codon:yes stop_codon:yes gene_type:complete
LAKLKGKAKAEFLKKMALGRKKAKSATIPGSKKRKTATKKRKTATINKTKSKRKSMVSRRRKYSGRARSGGLKIGNSLKTGIIGEVVKGIGAGSLVGMVMNRVMPGSNITPIASTAAAFLAGGVTGGAAQVVLSGGLANFGGMFGGSNQNVTAQVEHGV